MVPLPLTITVYPDQHVVCLEGDDVSYADLDAEQALALASELIGAAMQLDREVVLANLTSMMGDIVRAV